MLFIGLKDNDGQNFNIGDCPVRWKKTNQKYVFYGMYIKIWNIINNDNTYIVSQYLVYGAQYNSNSGKWFKWFDNQNAANNVIN